MGRLYPKGRRPNKAELLIRRPPRGIGEITFLSSSICSIQGLNDLRNYSYRSLQLKIRAIDSNNERVKIPHLTKILIVELLISCSCLLQILCAAIIHLFYKSSLRYLEIVNRCYYSEGSKAFSWLVTRNNRSKCYFDQSKLSFSTLCMQWNMIRV